jgi:ubiquitin-protein ligase
MNNTMNDSFANGFDMDSETDWKRLVAELETIPCGAIKRRIKGEFTALKEQCSSVHINYTNCNKAYDTPVLHITIVDKLHKNNVYSFLIGEYYPFKPPKVEFNFVNYSAFLKTSHMSSILLHQLRGISCLCCSSITCKDNWSPAITINHIIEEIRTYQTYKKQIIYKVFADKIKDKYLIADIDLDSWLF